MANKKIVIEVPIFDSKKRSKVRKIVAGFLGKYQFWSGGPSRGVSSISDENGKITVVGGYGVDPVKLTLCIREKVCGSAQLVLVKPVEEEEEEPQPSPSAVVQPSYPYGVPSYYCYEI